MKKNNKGLTLVELVVVIAIASVLLLSIGLGVNAIFSNKSKAASKTIYNMLGVAQNLGTSKDNCYLAIKADDKGKITVLVLTKKSDGTYTTVDEEDFTKVEVNLKFKNGSSMLMDTNKVVLISINRTTGGFDTAVSVNQSYNNPTSLTSCTDIIIDGKYDIALSNTGKFYYKD